MPKPYKTKIKFYPEKISHFERKGTAEKPKNYLPGIDSTLQEVFKANLGLGLFKEGHCHGGMTIQDIQFAVVLL